MRLLLVEDDKIIGDAVKQGLMLDGYAVDWVEDKESGKTALESNVYEILILDLGLPDGSGVEILKSLRAKGNDILILILTAYDDVTYRVKGLDAGADDYLVKPFDLDELLARLRALRRRREGRVSPVIRVGTVTLEPSSRLVQKDGKTVDLGPKEYSILQLLMEKAGRVISKAQIEESLYGWNQEIESNTVEVHIHGLRQKLGREFITTIRNVGYRVGNVDA